jgi:hypothetical protein
MFPEDRTLFAAADATRRISICTRRKKIRRAARSFRFFFFGISAQQNVSCYSYAMPSRETKSGKLAPLWRAMVEVGFIIFLFYSNLLMGEFTQSNGAGKSLAFAIKDIFTVVNFGVAIFSGLIGYVVFEYLRKRI